AHSFIAEHKVMAESPRLGVEDTLLFTFVIDWRVMAGSDQILNRYEFIFTQKENVMRYGIPERHLVFLYVETRVKLRETLLEPQRPVARCYAGNQVGGVVKDHVHWH